MDMGVSRTGVVTVRTPGSPDPVEVGRIELARFPNPPACAPWARTSIRRPRRSGDPQTGFAQENGFGRMLQGGLEGSNVEIVTEMVDMITAMRAYEINSKAVQSAEQMAETANQLIR